MRVVIALGGHALARPGDPPDAEHQRQRIAEAARAVADIAAAHDVVLTHGNGPQVGWLAWPHAGAPPLPLDAAGAESEGMIGYWLERELAGIFPTTEIATLLTQVEVDPRDPAFAAPTKPIGPLLSRADAEAMASRFGWVIRPYGGGYRRAVASPRPRRIRELHTVRLLVEAGVLVVCAGGGGIPVMEGPEGGYRGVEAVIDKDRTSSLLAVGLDADRLLLLTDVSAVLRDWPAPGEEPVSEVTPEQLQAMDLEPGSMGPKAEAAAEFVLQTGGIAMIGALEQAREVFAGRAGTRVRPPA